jgi:hypothetical protein
MTDIYVRSLRPLIVALIPGQQRDLDKLKTMRVQLSNEVADLINDFGPTLYDDFNEVRFLFFCDIITSTWCHPSGVFWSLQQAFHLRAVPQVYGDGRAAPVQLMLKALVSLIP